MLFSAWQAATHALQFTHAVRSIDIPHAMPGIFPLRIEREVLFDVGLNAAHEFGIAPVTFRSVLQDQVAPLHLLLRLGGGEWKSGAGFLDTQSTRRPKCVGGSQWIGAEPGAIGAASPAGASVAQGDCQAVFGLPWRDPNCPHHRAAPHAKSHQIPGFDVKAASCPRAHVDGIVPGQLGNRAGKFLEPAIIRVRAVVDVRVGPKHQFQIRGSLRSRRQRPGRRDGRLDGR